MHFGQLWEVLQCLEYVTRRDHVRYIAEETDWLERMVSSTRWLYLVDVKKPRTEMVAYA